MWTTACQSFTAHFEALLLIPKVSFAFSAQHVNIIITFNMWLETHMIYHCFYSGKELNSFVYSRLCVVH
jgi:hypothetical protein